MYFYGCRYQRTRERFEFQKSQTALAAYIERRGREEDEYDDDDDD